jgi:hypothetical protein
VGFFVSMNVPAFHLLVWFGYLIPCSS